MKTENVREVSLEEIVDLPVWPMADIFPMLAKNSLERDTGKADKQTTTLSELAESIIENGQQEPIVQFNHEGTVYLLDGRNRRAACIQGKVETIIVEDFVGSETEADNYVIALNLHRRDLTAGQRAVVGAKMREIEMLRSKQRQGTRTDLTGEVAAEFGSTRSVIARKVGANHNYVDKVCKELDAINSATAKAQELQDKALEMEKAEAEAQAKLVAAKAIADAEAIREAAIAANEAINAKIDLRERAAAESDLAATKQRKIDRVQKGESFNSVYGEQKQKEQTDDPIAQLRTRINSGFTNLKQAVTDLAKAGGQGEDDWNFVSRKIDDFIRNLEEAFDMEV